MPTVSLVSFADRPAVLKRYAHTETERLKCIGSGARNEALLPNTLAGLAPSLLAFSSNNEEEIVVLSHHTGRNLQVEEIGPIEAQMSGEVLGQIHSVTGAFFGSLDGNYRFDTLSDAFAGRWNVAMRLLHGVDRGLAADVNTWALPLIRQLNIFWPPRLVHGDFGLSNLLWHPSRQMPIVLDWEHAHFGDPREDWAKIHLATRFLEPNGFGSDDVVLDTLWHGWLKTVRAIYLPAGPFMQLYEAYYAATLGVFFEGDGYNRLEWLASQIRESPSF